MLASELQFDVSAACLMTKNEVEVDHIVKKHEVKVLNLDNDVEIDSQQNLPSFKQERTRGLCCT